MRHARTPEDPTPIGDALRHWRARPLVLLEDLIGVAMLAALAWGGTWAVAVLG